MIEEFYLVGHDAEARPVYGTILKSTKVGDVHIALYRDSDATVEVILSGHVEPHWQPQLHAKKAGTYASGMEGDLPIWQTDDKTCWRGHIVKQQQMGHKPHTIHQRTLFFMQRVAITPTEAFAKDDPHVYEWVT
jgi:hypothetical protein